MQFGVLLDVFLMGKGSVLGGLGKRVVFLGVEVGSWECNGWEVVVGVFFDGKGIGYERDLGGGAPDGGESGDGPGAWG